ncbi:MAG: hypothetical protein ACK5NT_13925 [Pyrinomonadaceae bacterium]
MEVVDDLGNEIVFAVLVDKSKRNKIDSKEIIPLLQRIRESLQGVEMLDHTRIEPIATAAAV